MASKRKNKKKSNAVRQPKEQARSTASEPAQVQDAHVPEEAPADAQPPVAGVEQADVPEAGAPETERTEETGQGAAEQPGVPGESAPVTQAADAPAGDAPENARRNEPEPSVPEPDASLTEDVPVPEEAPAPQDIPEAFDLPPELEAMPFELPAVPKKMAGGADEKKKRRRKKRRRRKRHVLFWVFMFLTLAVAGGSASYIYWLFTEADSVIFDMKADVELPNFVGLRWEDVENDAAYSGFRLEMQEVYHDEAPAGQIVDQNPRAPRDVKERSTIVVKVSKGVETVVVPDLAGWNKDTAKERLRGMNLTLMIRPEENNDVPSDSVIRTVPEAGTLVKAGTTITLYIRSESKELGYVSVPTCIGADSMQQASMRLTQRGLQMHAISQEDAAPAGTIIAQSPAPGTMVLRGATVNVTISTGPPPPPPEVPSSEPESSSTPWWGDNPPTIGAGPGTSSSTEPQEPQPPAVVAPNLPEPAESNAGAQP